MNLWARTLRQLTVLAVALFFFSCEDETSILGFKNPNKKFKVNFVDIPLESSVILLDSLRTSNYIVQGEVNRLLVGKYTDDVFGDVSATALSQFFPTNTSNALLKETAVLDSVSIQLAFDLYQYGSVAQSQQTISVHELDQELSFENRAFFFNKTETPYNPSPLGTTTFSISPEQFKNYVRDKVDTTLSINFPINLEFGQRIFDKAKLWNQTKPADSTYGKYTEFVKTFKGVAIVPDNADKILGYNPATVSRIILHYHDAVDDSLQLYLSLGNVVGYSRITADRSTGPLAGLTEYSKSFDPSSDFRYLQAGTGVLTRLDFEKFYDLVDQDTNANMVVNSAELLLGPPQAAAFDPVTSMTLRAIKGNEGHLKKTVDPTVNKAQHLADSASVSLYAGQLGVTGGNFTPLAVNGSVLVVTRTGTNTYYNAFLTLFAQQLFKREENKERFRYFALYPESPPSGKSVNRTILHKDEIKLRVYYTRSARTSQ